MFVIKFVQLLHIAKEEITADHLTAMFLIIMFKSSESENQSICLLDDQTLDLHDMSTRSSNIVNDFFRRLGEKFARWSVCINISIEEVALLTCLGLRETNDSEISQTQFRTYSALLDNS